MHAEHSITGMVMKYVTTSAERRYVQGIYSIHVRKASNQCMQISIIQPMHARHLANEETLQAKEEQALNQGANDNQEPFGNVWDR